MTREEIGELSDKLADVLWWVSGWIAAHPEGELDGCHVGALREARIILRKMATDDAAPLDDARYQAAMKLVHDLRAENDHYRDAIGWALGERGDFATARLQSDSTPYWWRRELRRRAGLLCNQVPAKDDQAGDQKKEAGG